MNRKVTRARFSRSDIEKIFGVGKTTVRRWEKAHRLSPRRDRRNWVYFEAADVEVLARVRGVDLQKELSANGRAEPSPELSRVAVTSTPLPPAAFASDEIATAVFAMFDEGLSLRQVVAKVRKNPVILRDLHREWLTPLERVPPTTVKEG